LEANKDGSYGGEKISADIRSGKIVSYHNTPIASYGIAVSNEPDKKYASRITGFVKNCEIYGLPSQEEYELESGKNPDYGIMADDNELYNPLKCTTSLEKRVNSLGEQIGLLGDDVNESIIAKITSLETNKINPLSVRLGELSGKVIVNNTLIANIRGDVTNIGGIVSGV
jgi:hypothetical protein